MVAADAVPADNVVDVVDGGSGAAGQKDDAVLEQPNSSPFPPEHEAYCLALHPVLVHPVGLPYYNCNTLFILLRRRMDTLQLLFVTRILCIDYQHIDRKCQQKIKNY